MDDEDRQWELPEQDIGGYVYERAYFTFRFAPSNSTPASQLEDYQEELLRPIEDALEDILDPTLPELQCYIYAMELYAQTDRWGLPLGGGWMHQPSFEMYVINCVATARERADREMRAVEAQQQAEADKAAQDQAQ